MFVYIQIALGVVAILILSRIVTGVAGERAYRRTTVFVGVLLACVALVLLTIGARSPYTHANLAPRYDDRYDRTVQIVVGEVADLGRGSGAAAGGPAGRGEALFVSAGCAGCHSLGGRGGTVAKAIAGVDQALLLRRVRGGTAGMPVFSPSSLTDEEVAEIAAYLGSLGAAR